MDRQDDGNERVLRRSILRTLGLLLLCSIFVAVGVWMISEGKAKGWFVSCVFGPGVIVALVQLLPNASYLRLTEDGFEVRTMYRLWSVPWNEVAFFTVAKVGHNKMVVFSFSERYDRAKVGRRIARAMAGYEGALPETYGLKADQLAALLSKWKDRFDQG